MLYTGSPLSFLTIFRLCYSLFCQMILGLFLDIVNE
jgi:hypothetical protein